MITTIKRSKKKELRPHEVDWLEEYMATGNASEASRKIGVEKCPAQHGARMRRTLSDYIQANVSAMIGKCVPSALETVYELATSCPDPNIRLRAAIDILDRAGHKQAERLEISMSNKSDDELNSEIDALLNANGIIDVQKEA